MNNLALINNHMELPYLDDVITVAYTNTLTDETKRTYLSTILEFFNVSDLNDISVANIRSITPEIATTWAHQLIKNGLAIATVNKKLSSLQSFYKFLCRRNVGIMSYNVNFHIISDWFNHNKTDRNVRKSVKILVGEKRIPVF